MSKSNTLETQLLLAIFESPTLTAIGTIPLGLNLFMSAYTADPGEAGTAITNEADFTGYGRKTMPRDAATWTVTGDTVTSDIDADFPLCTGGTNTVSHWAVVNTASGTGTILYKGTIKESGVATTRAISNGIQLIIPAGSTTITED